MPRVLFGLFHEPYSNSGIFWRLLLICGETAGRTRRELYDDTPCMKHSKQPKRIFDVGERRLANHRYAIPGKAVIARIFNAVHPIYAILPPKEGHIRGGRQIMENSEL